jgi:hypothetical protein
VLPELGGWTKVLDCFESEYVGYMDRYRNGLVVLLIDFDGNADRLNYAKKRIPGHLAERVFIIGALNEPEELKRAGLGSYENIGKALAQDCRQETNTTWQHNLLQHNAGELDRLRERVRPILF